MLPPRMIVYMFWFFRLLVASGVHGSDDEKDVGLRVRSESLSRCLCIGQTPMGIQQRVGAALRTVQTSVVSGRRCSCCCFWEKLRRNSSS